MSQPLEYPAQAVHELNSGNVHSAIQILERQLTFSNADIASLHLLGIIYLQSNNHRAAQQFLDRAVQLTSDNELIYFHRAIACESQGLHDEALASLDKAISLRPDFFEAHLIAGRILAAADRLSQALVHFDQALKASPHSDEALADFNQTLRRLEDAVHGRAYNNFGPIVVTSQVHSAGNYIYAELARQLRLCPRRNLTNDLTCWVNRDNLDELIAKGGIALDHTSPRIENLLIFHHSGLKKLLVLIRDPRQAVYSTTRWYDHIKVRASQPNWPGFELPVMEAMLPEGYYSWPFEKKLDAMIETELPLSLKWLKGWFDASVDKRWNFEIKFGKHEDLKRDGKQFFHSILDFYGINPTALRDEIRDSRPGENGTPGEHAFRKGSTDEWRREMSADQIRRVNELVPDDLLAGFGWTR